MGKRSEARGQPASRCGAFVNLKPNTFLLRKPTDGKRQHNTVLDNKTAVFSHILKPASRLIALEDCNPFLSLLCFTCDMEVCCVQQHGDSLRSFLVQSRQDTFWVHQNIKPWTPNMAPVVLHRPPCTLLINSAVLPFNRHRQTR